MEKIFQSRTGNEVFIQDGGFVVKGDVKTLLNELKEDFTDNNPQVSNSAKIMYTLIDAGKYTKYEKAS